MDISETIIPKSDQLNADDLLAGPITITVTAVKKGSPEQPVEVHWEGGDKCASLGGEGRPYKPSKSMRRVLAYCWGREASAWVGRSLTLYRDESIKYGGEAVGGIRISHVSHIDGPKPLALTVTRGKRVPYQVRPLAASKAEGTSPAYVPHLPPPMPEKGCLPIEHLRKEGRASAEKGSEELKKFWAWLGKEEKAALKRDLDKDLKQIAAQADKEAEAREGEFAL